ncbi:MAG: alanine--tRNA ligase [Limisphaerales bacterium]
MTSAQIRQSFLDFFKSKGHTLVPSGSLMPDSPNLLFTNAGMNQFVPIFLGQKSADVSKWAGAVPGADTRAADTQKCSRAGGKHNDLDDVGLDTYHHTFFEMLGNWSFGDYFKKEAIDWAWELVVEKWHFPPKRLYATVYAPDNNQNDPGEFDQESWNHWAEKFKSVGLDPNIHVVNGGKKDNFWMMGETGPCGPCSEMHVDLTREGHTEGRLVNKGDARCIEIWNLVFIQYNANPDGAFSALPARHVDTGMGFERVTSIIQGTRGLTDFGGARISNYETDIFRPIFDALEKLSGRRYGRTLPGTAPRPQELPIKSSGECRGHIIEVPELPAHPGPASDDKGVPDDPAAVVSSEQIAVDIAFRVIADHIRTLSFAIADGIQPGNEGRGYVLRRILRRAVRYGRNLGFHEPFFYHLVDVLAETMGAVFPEIRAKKKQVRDTIRFEEEAFNKTLDRGIELFNGAVAQASGNGVVAGAFAFQLYDTYGFPLDLTELMARERGLSVDKEGFEKLMEQQRERGRAAQKKEFITVSQIETTTPTKFVGYEKLAVEAKVLELVSLKEKTAIVLDASPFYAEMGGQVGDMGRIEQGAQFWRVTNTQKSGNTWLHVLDAPASPDAPRPAADVPSAGSTVTLTVDGHRRSAIERHHTVTHLLHWALHEVVSREASQKGSYVGPEKLTFDFNSAPLTPQQVADIEKLVNERILENAAVSWTETPYTEVRSRKDVMQFFGEKYGERVRVVQIGGHSGRLDGYSMELCGGTHTRATGEIGLFRISGESAIAAGVRRIEAVAGLEAYSRACHESLRIKSLATRLNSPVHELEKKIESLLEQQKALEKSLRNATMREASNAASNLLEQAQAVNGIPSLIHNVGAVEGDFLQAVADSLKGRFNGVIVLGGASGGAVSLVAAVSPDWTSKIQAGKIIQQIAPIVGGKGGGKPDNARGGGKDAARLDEALAKARHMLVP